MRHIKLFESLYSDVSATSGKILSDFAKFEVEHTKRKAKLEAEIRAELCDEIKRVQGSLDEAVSEYVTTIKECMVDVEDFQTEDADLDILRQNYCYRVVHRFQTEDVKTFMNVNFKLDETLGKGSYEYKYIIYFESGNMSFASEGFKDGNRHQSIVGFEKTLQSLLDAKRYNFRKIESMYLFKAS